MYACVPETRRGFFEVACDQEYRHLIFVTHPYRSSIRRLIWACTVCLGILAAANLYSPFQHRVVGNMPRARG
jgi:hypothetical protein